jgi:hypothetical protein
MNLLFNFPTLFDWIEWASFLRGQPAALLVLATAVLITLFWDWRLALLALLAQYLAAALLFIDLLEPRLAIVKLFVGLFVCLMIYWTARQTAWRLPKPEGVWRLRLGPLTLPFTRGALLRLVGVLILTPAVMLLAPRAALRLPGLTAALAHVNLAVLGLAGLGLLALAVSRDPLPAGMGLLTFLTGFELFYSALDQSVAMLIALAALNFVLALAIAYLTQSRPASLAARYPQPAGPD